MPTGQQYATNVPQTTLTGLINATATVMSVASSSGWPATPFTAILEIGTSLQEPIDVTNITGTTWTIVRAIDSTVGFTHQVGATVTHGDIGRDFREARSHIDASTGVHGVTGAVVGTTDSQTLSGKTYAAAVFTSGATMGTGTWNGTGQLNEASLGFSGLSGATFQNSRIVGTTNTGGPPTSNTWTTGDIVLDTVYNVLWVCTSGGTQGTWVPLGGRAKIGSTAPTGASTTITIPSWVNTVYGVWTARTDNAVTGGYVNLRINADSGSNYTWEQVLGATNAVSGQNSGGTQTSMHIGAKTGASDTASYFGSGSFTIANAQNTSLFKSVHSVSNAVGSTTGGFAGTHGGTWLSTAAVTGVTLLPDAGNFVTGSSLVVYGMV